MAFFTPGIEGNIHPRFQIAAVFLVATIMYSSKNDMGRQGS